MLCWRQKCITRLVNLYKLFAAETRSRSVPCSLSSPSGKESVLKGWEKGVPSLLNAGIDLALLAVPQGDASHTTIGLDVYKDFQKKGLVVQTCEIYMESTKFGSCLMVNCNGMEAFKDISSRNSTGAREKFNYHLIIKCPKMALRHSIGDKRVVKLEFTCTFFRA